MVSLHCKGGKGRTGTMICAILIDMGLFSNARDSLQYFGQRRTDLNVSQQFQGVETYSQVTPFINKISVLFVCGRDTAIINSSLILDPICSLLSNVETTTNQRHSPSAINGQENKDNW